MNLQVLSDAAYFVYYTIKEEGAAARVKTTYVRQPLSQRSDAIRHTLWEINLGKLIH